MNDQQVASADTQTFTFELFDTLYEEDCVTPENHVSEGAIAPGTGGSFTLKIENLSQVDAELTVVLTENNENSIPIQYSNDLSDWHDDLSFLQDMFTDFFLERETGIAGTTVYWRWCYTDSDTAHFGQTDDTDTALGFLALTEDVKLTITADLTVGQYVPRPEAPAQDLLAAAEITDTSITLQAIEGAEYSMDDITWQDSPTFTGLTPGTEYTLYVRYKETDNDLASKSSSIQLNTTITYTDFVITVENRHKIGFTNQTTDLEIPETFYDEENQTWYRVVGIEEGFTQNYQNHGAFSRCYNLRTVTLPKTITDIPKYTFTGCGNLTNITIPEDVTTIGKDAFSDCTSLENITIPSSVTTIADSAFSFCYFDEIVFGSNLTNIGTGAFYYPVDDADLDNPEAYLATTITGGNGVVYSYDWASDNRSVEFADVEYTDFVITAENRAKVGYTVGTGMDELDLVIPKTFYDEEDGKWYKVVGIGDRAFEECWNLNSVFIPHSVTSIGAYAFAYDGLSSVTISEGVITIGEGAFDGVGGLTTITIPNSVTTIGAGAFGWCSDLTEITFGSGITFIGSNAFYESEESVDTPVATTIHGGNSVVWSYDWNGDNRSVEFEDMPEFTNLYLSYPNTYKIGYTQDETTHLSIPAFFYDEEDGKWYKVVGFETDWDDDTGDLRGAFCYTSNLRSVVIPGSVESVGMVSFFSCHDLESVTIGNGVTSIDVDAFYLCQNLTKVYLPATITSLDDRAFEYCDTLTDIYFAGTESQWNDISFGENALDPNVTVHYNYTAE